MAKKDFIPGAEKSDADRSIESLSRFADFVAKNPLVNGVLVDVEPTQDGPLEVPHGLGRRASGAMVVGSDIGVYSVSVSDSDDRSATVAIAPQWELLERVDVKKVENLIDFGVGLNADDDGEYLVHGYWIPNQTATASLRYRFNGTITSSFAGDGYAYRQDAANGTAAGLSLARSSGSEAQYIMIWNTLVAATGQYKFSHGHTTTTSGTTAAGTQDTTLAGKMHDTTTRVKSLGIQSAQANDIAAGSWFTLYRRPRVTGRKLKLWIF